MPIKYLAAAILFLTATMAHSGVAGFLTRNPVDWKFIQTVGGMKVSLKEKLLHVDCDVSGLRKVTVKPTMINSALGVRTMKVSRKGKTIRLSVVTSVLEKGMTTSCKPVDLSEYPAGEYTVEYVDPDGAGHALGKIRLGK